MLWRSFIYVRRRVSKYLIVPETTVVKSVYVLRSVHMVDIFYELLHCSELHCQPMIIGVCVHSCYYWTSSSAVDIMCLILCVPVDNIKLNNRCAVFVKICTIYAHGSHASLKVVESTSIFILNSRPLKVLQNRTGAWKSLNSPSQTVRYQQFC